MIFQWLDFVSVTALKSIRLTHRDHPLATICINGNQNGADSYSSAKQIHLFFKLIAVNKMHA